MSDRGYPRKRDRLRSFFSRSIQADEISSPAPSKPTPSASDPPDFATSDILGRALELLDPQARAALSAYSSGAGVGIETVVDETHVEALRCKEAADRSGISWKFGGRSVHVRDAAEKVVRWVDRFKSVGDVIANVDPIHVGLPWAGIRMILEVATADARQMNALVTGLDLALAMANRLAVYLKFHSQLPPVASTAVFQGDLVKTYADLLRFLAQAIKTFQTHTAVRVFKALWDTSDVASFADKCQGHGQQLESAAQACFREVSGERWEEVRRWKGLLEDDVRKLDGIQDLQQSLAELQIHVDLGQLVYAEGATFDSFADSLSGECLAETRVQLLKDIADWPSGHGKTIFWLCGKAGIGKSTVARTVARRFHNDGRLGASFFFKRTEADRSHAKRFFPTTALQLADKIPGLKEPIAQALEKDSLLCERDLATQFERLLLQPLRVIEAKARSHMVVVIDALDECSDEDQVKTVLRLLSRLASETTLRIHVFVTSRPELPIKIGFKKMQDSVYQRVILEDTQV